MFISELLDNPAEALRSLLIALPGILLALSCHEAAHGYIAYRCGDPTAKLCGRLTLNPLRHVNPMGLICMLLIGMGWATPVPVNPNNFRHGRRDDLRVSMAGITANLALFLLCFLLITALCFTALSMLPKYDIYEYYTSDVGSCLVEYSGDTVFVFENGGYIDSESLFSFSSGMYYYTSDNGGKLTFESCVIEPALGSFAAVLYEMLASCMLINLSLAVFNLLPIPPLDGYHLLNDLLLKKNLFVKQKTARIASTVLIILIVVGNYNSDLNIISKAISWVHTTALDSFTSLTHLLAQAIGII